MTFSIVANDRDAGYCGSAVGHRVLDEMENGEPPHEALASVLDSDGAALHELFRREFEG